MKTTLFSIVTLAVSLAFAQETATNVYRLGAANAERPRMVVVNFRPATGDTFSWCGKNESTATWAGALADKLNEKMVQTRAFTMIDRKFDAEIQDEIRRLSDKNAAKGDLVRLCQRLGTDYMIVGDIRFSPIRSAAVNPLTGQALPSVPQRFAEISYRVILAPTGEIVWAATVMLGSEEFPAADIASFMSISADVGARRIAEETMANLFPPPPVTKAEADPQPPAPARSAPVTASPSDTTVRGTGNGGVITPF